MTGRGHDLLCGLMQGLSGVLRRILRRETTAPYRSFPAVPAIFCLGIVLVFFLIAPAAAEGFVKSDCNCQLSGVSVKSQTLENNNDRLVCYWTKTSASSGDPPWLYASVTKEDDIAWALSKLQELNEKNRAGSGGSSCIEQTYTSTRSASVCGDTTFGGGRTIIYRNSYSLAVGGADFSRQEFISYLDQLETCMERAADTHASRQSGTSTPGAITTIKKPTATVKPGTTTARPGTTSGPGVTPGPGQPAQNLSQGLGQLGDAINRVSPLPVNWTGVPGAMSGSTIPAVVGALGAVVGASVGALSLFPPGFSWPGSERGEGGEGGEGGGRTGEQPGTSDMQAETQAAEDYGPTLLEMEIAGIGAGGQIDRVGAPPLSDGSDTDQSGSDESMESPTAPPGDLSSTDGSEIQGSELPGGGTGQAAPEEIAEGGSTITDQAAPETVGDIGNKPEESPLPESTSSGTMSGDLDQEMTLLQQRIDLQSRVNEILQDKINKGYTVINPDWIRIWHRSFFAARVGIGDYRLPSYYDFTEKIGLQGPRGRCTEFADWGAEWIKEDVTKIFGRGTYVDKIALNPDGWSNHVATHVTTPQGQKYVIDFWEGTHNGTTKVYSEAEWIDKWKEKLGGDVPEYRNLMERKLEKMIRVHGEEHGLEIFREYYTQDKAETETIINGYKQHPWFKV